MVEKNSLPTRSWGDMPTGGPKHEFREGLMIRLLQAALPQGRILDAGAGDGTLTLKLASLGYSVLALDASADCIALLKQKLEAAPFRDRVSLAQGKLPDTGLAEASLDGIVSGEVVEHFQDDRGLVREFSRLLKPGGVCVVSVPADPGKWDLNDEWSGHFRRYHAHDLERLFTGAGFSVGTIHYWGWPLGYLFHRLFYLPWLRRHHHLDGRSRSRTLSTRVGVSPFVSKFIALIFGIDNLFNRLPYGIGLVGSFRKI
jgi:SAM-dependent methyltransferase